ncbi:DUF4381 domain-containing protein [Vibrio sp. ZSDE26]|uniref:DUF4381 domain-containing protein n=1 Tax=Vibrio amylolyticus TaxID=2847292 RepID=A0A9X1XI50_9VIBR|nr:DUF4381 domain-containing protein [Vibrio amylolyticus]MCK6262781.1 DUF4381 domain-containing protein [Vibrio amylolyticus]
MSSVDNLNSTNAHEGSVTEFGAHLIKNLEWRTLPTPVSWFPATTAWYTLFALILLAIIGAVFYRRLKWLRASYLREAATLFEEYLQTDHQRIGHLVKRVANQHWPEGKVGVMNATAFYQFLQQQQGELSLSNSCCEALLQTSYQPNVVLSEQHVAEVRAWLGALYV